MNIADEAGKIVDDAINIASNSDRADIGNVNAVFTEMVKGYAMGVELAGRRFSHFDGLYIQAMRHMAVNACQEDPSSDNACKVAALMRCLLVVQAKHDLGEQEAKRQAEEYQAHIKATDPANGAPASPVQAGDALTGYPTPTQPMNGYNAPSLGPNMRMPDVVPDRARTGSELFVEALSRHNFQFEALEGMQWPQSWTRDDQETYIQYVRPLQAQHLDYKRKMAEVSKMPYGQGSF